MKRKLNLGLIALFALPLVSCSSQQKKEDRDYLIRVAVPSGCYKVDKQQQYEVKR